MVDSISVSLGRKKENQIPFCSQCKRFPLYLLNKENPSEVYEICPSCNIKNNTRNKRTSIPIKNLINYIELEGKEFPEYKCETEGHQNNEAIVFCRTCEYWLCKQCYIIHKNDSHKLDPNKNHVSEKCSKHKNDFEQYCSDCNLNLCKECLSEHNGHKVIEFKDNMNIKLFQDQRVLVRNHVGQTGKIFNRFIEIIDKYKKDIESAYNKTKEINDKILKIYDHFLSYAVSYKKNYYVYLNLQNFCKFSPKKFSYDDSTQIKLETLKSSDFVDYLSYLENNSLIIQKEENDTNVRSLQKMRNISHPNFVCSTLFFKSKNMNKEFLFIGSNHGKINIEDVNIEKKKKSGDSKNKKEDDLEIYKHKGPILSLYNDNLFIYSGGTDQFIKKWKIEEEKVTIKLKYATKYVGHEDGVYKIISNPGYDNIISCSSDKKVIFWKTVPNEYNFIEKEKQYLFDNPVISIARLRNSNYLIVSTNNGKIFLYDVKTDVNLSQINNIDCNYPECLKERTDDILVGGGYYINVLSVKNKCLVVDVKMDLNEIAENEKKANNDLEFTQNLVNIIPEGMNKILFSNSKNMIYDLSLSDGKVRNKKLNREEKIDGFVQIGENRYAVIFGTNIEIMSS